MYIIHFLHNFVIGKIIFKNVVMGKKYPEGEFLGKKYKRVERAQTLKKRTIQRGRVWSKFQLKIGY